MLNGSDNANPAGLPKSCLPRVQYLLHPKDPLCNTGEEIYNNTYPFSTHSERRKRQIAQTNNIHVDSAEKHQLKFGYTIVL